MGGDTNISQPAQPSYGEGLSEALQAQVGLLTGTGDFADTGSLESLLPLEESIRRKTAQADTDILRQTLLGGEEGGETQEVTYDDQGRAISGYSEPGEARMRAIVEDADGRQLQGSEAYGKAVGGRAYVEFIDEQGNVVERGAAVPLTGDETEDSSIAAHGYRSLDTALDNTISALENNPSFDAETLKKIKDDRASISKFSTKILPGLENANGYKLSENQNSYAVTEAQPIFAKDTEGNIIQDASKAGTTETTTLPTFRSGDGMVDLLGDQRGVQDTQSREVTTRKGGYAYTGDPSKPPGYRFDSDKDYSLFDEQGNEIASGLDLYQARAQSDDIEATTTTETVYEQSDSGRQAGFASAEDGGGFLGLSAFSEDLAAGNLSRQRERDLLDVARLSGTYQDIMEDYKPGTQQALSDAREVLALQKDTLTGAGAITVPKDSTFATMGNVNVADPLQLQANTQFDQELLRGTDFAGYMRNNPDLMKAFEAERQGGGTKTLEEFGRDHYNEYGRAEGRQIGGTLRSDILTDAKTALGQGLTSREERQIAEAARARSTMMGRTFDQSGAIAEAEARVAEDNARRMQNRAFAQSVLGQEAGLQQGDITRGMAQESEQAGLQQRADLVQSDVDLRSALANQAQLQQANQFGVGATMDAQRLNEQLSQQGTLGYIQAAGNLAALEDQSTLDPFQAVLGRGGGQSLQAGQSVFGQAGYGLNSGPQYLNPEAGLGFIQNQAVNAANMYGAQVGAEAAKTAGLYSALGSIGGGATSAATAAALCWVAREVYGVHNPAWMAFRYWMLNESPSWFRATYIKYGERFANFISDKPRLKARIRMWMDTKIRR